ncbi:PepSY-associated TM helix domain-containing protein [Sphingomonas adhaesiva]|uniref:PepSY-associated TM helix domain-containing protein n=1 Tax=Sphingomonas adhaesiva TaxID=28212 RepID=UPI002FF6081F
MTAARTRGWPLSPATVRAVLSGHGILGLAFAAVIYLVCLTGTLAVFVHDLERWEQPGQPRAAVIAAPALDRAVATARRLAPPDAGLYIGLPSGAEPGATLVAYSPAFEREWGIASDGALAAKATPFADFLLDLHIALHLPRRWGAFIVGLAGVALLSSLVSGLLAHPRMFKDAFHLRLGGARRLQEADLHNRLGIWALPFHVVIALTGALLGLSTLIVGVLAMLLYRGDTTRVYGLFIDAPPAVDRAAAPLPPLATLLAEAQRRAPGATPHQIIVERAGRSDARVTIVSVRDRLLVPQDTTVFDARGAVVKDQHPRDLVVGTRILGGIGQLHFGWYGGVAVRVLYGLLGLALCVVTSSGVTIWLARRRDKGRADPRWERLWAAVAWGQPLALLLAAATAVAGAGRTAVAVWLVTTVLLLVGAGAARPPASRLAAGLRATSGGAGVVLAMIHLTRVPWTSTGTIVDALLLSGGAWLLWRHRRGAVAGRA